MDPLATDSKFVILVGGSSIGKTRSAFEAVRDRLAGWQLIHPLTAADLIALVRRGRVHPRTVLWLDESQTYLERGDAGEPAAAVRSLLANVRPVLVVGTLWPDFWLSYTRPPEFGAPGPFRQARHLLGAAVKIDIPDRFNDRDIQAAQALAAKDPRLAIALRAQHGHRVTQVLAGGSDLIDRWQTPRVLTVRPLPARQSMHGGSAISAPCRRDSLPTPRWRTSTRPQLAIAPSDWFTRALAYACDPVKGAIAPITATSQALGQTEGYLLADYLDKHGRTARRASNVPDTVWAALATHTVVKRS